jgi:hypothetical protein
MLQKYSRVAQNLPLSPGEFEFSEFSEDEEYPNDAEGREIQKQDLTTRPWLDQENNNRSGSNKKCRICFYGLIAICCTLLFFSGAFYICEAKIEKTKTEYLNLLLNCSKREFDERGSKASARTRRIKLTWSGRYK